jgi:pimeloyl-ACP methyl ester carboxylesterase
MKLKQSFQQFAILSLLLLLLSLGGCADLKNYHDKAKYSPNVAACPLNEAIPKEPEADDPCSSYALQRYKNGKDEDYLLGFVELDDQGQLFNREQVNAVTKEFSQYEDLIMVVFVHGWFNNADPANDNLKQFREVLKKLSQQEAALSKSEGGRPKRQIAGVYIGWRGESIDVPPFKYLTFWDRKNTAHKVGHAGLTEVLVRFDRIKKINNKRQGNSNTKLVIVGHSFGGAAVYSALSQILVQGFVNTEPPERIDNFGNLVLLINPATEALQFSPLHDMAIEKKSYSEDQLPVFAVLAARNDVPVGWLFPMGRWFSTIFEKPRTLDVKRYNAVTGQTESLDEDEANRLALGHFGPYTNYWLDKGACSEPQRSLTRAAHVQTNTSEQAFAFHFLQTAGDAWDSGASQIPFNGESFVGCLERDKGDKETNKTNRTAPRNPYLVISVDKDIINGHSDLSSANMREFIRGMVLLATQKPTAVERGKVRVKMMELERKLK